MSFKPLLSELVAKGKPLAEIVVEVEYSETLESVTNLLDQLAPDIGAAIEPAYFQAFDQPIVYELRMDATREALEREFGWVLSRDPYDEETYIWEETNQPQFYPSSLSGKIIQMGLTQPGASDNGNDDTVSYDHKFENTYPPNE
ncbi:MAG: hypothetical protein RIC89_16745 [Pseudomonadales bacterium]